MDKRTFYLKHGSSDKFWAIQLEGSSHTVNYGKTGTSGTTQTKDFPTESAARKS
ncbi:MAG: WGR domain-containing protein [Synechococcaceae cyanobacterium SM2_3_1]|nr:WGR domain-containing protein [Synechococcaceae cyanobacterium SM2_3_1]